MAQSDLIVELLLLMLFGRSWHKVTSRWLTAPSLANRSFMTQSDLIVELLLLVLFGRS